MASRTAELVARLVDQVSGPAKGMAGALDGVAAAGKKLGSTAAPGLDKLTRDLKEAQSQAEKLTQLQARMKTLATSRGAFNEARANVERIGRDLDAARRTAADGSRESARAVRDLEREQSRARATVRAASSAFEAEADAAKRLRRELSALGVPTTSLGKAQAAVATRAQAAARAIETRGRAEQRTRAADALAARAEVARSPARRGAERARRGLGMMGGRLLGPLAGAYGAYEAAGAYKQAAAFDRRITMIGQTADAGRAEIDGLASSVHSLAQETATPVDNLTGGLEALVAQGRNLRESMEFLPSVARTAAASASEVDDIAKTADSVGSNFKIAGRDMQAAFDIMAAGGKAGQFELKDMARYLPSLGPATAALGFKGQQGLADLVAMLQVMRKGSGTAEEAVASMTNILNKMESDKTTKGFKNLGIDSEAAFKKARKEGRNLVEVFEELLQKATKGDSSKIGEIIDDQEFKRGALALMAFRGEWQKLSRTLQSSSGGTVARDVVQVTKDAQAGVDRLSNSWQRATQAAARAADAMGASSRLGNIANVLEQTAQALERVNDAYNKGGLAGVAKTLGDATKEAVRDKLDESRPGRKVEQDKQIQEIEADIAATERTMKRTGRSQAQIDGVLRSKRAALSAARRARGDLEIEGNSLVGRPLSMGQDPASPIRGEAAPINGGSRSPGASIGAFQEAFPFDTSGRKPLPAVTPLPPRRPAGMISQGGIDKIEDVLGPASTITPKVDASQIEQLAPKVDAAKGKMTELGATSAAPTVSTASVDVFIARVGAAEAAMSRLEGRAASLTSTLGQAAAGVAAAGRTGAVAQARQNARTDTA